MRRWRIITADVLDGLRSLPDASVHCCVTSPPYWGLRDYGVEGQLGLESTPEEYVENMVEVFREVRRVLRDDGTLWLNLGDSYSAGTRDFNSFRRDRGHVCVPNRPVPDGLKPKDLVGIPWRVAFALQADGWWLRSDIIWAKPNPMPESVRDRPTKAHEYIFLLSKSERYFYDADAVAEPGSGREMWFGDCGYSDASGRNDGSGSERNETPAITRNRRTVWTIATKPFPDAHFAVFPPDLPEICISAGTSEKGCCSACGAPWERVVERTAMVVSPGPSREERELQRLRTQTNGTMVEAPTSKTVGWQPTCDHDAEPEPCTVLDPFAGAGTTLMVALRLQREAIGIELSEEYAEMARRRIDHDAPLFNRQYPTTETTHA